jgi:signal transduction histidine kinase
MPLLLRNPWQYDGVVYLLIALLVGIGFAQFTDTLTLGIILGLCTAFGLLQHFALHRLQSRGAAMTYLLAQGVLTTLLYGAAAARDPFLFPFFILSVQAMLLCTPRLAGSWIVAFFLTGALTVWAVQGRVTPVYLLFYAAAYAFCGSFGYALRQTELARRENERLLAELRSAHTQLRQFAVTEERNRLARDLHDSTKQQAFALSAQLDAVRSLLPRDPKLAETHLQQAEELADSLRQELAAMILDLRPPQLAHLPLAQALQKYTEEWARHSAIAATVSVRGTCTIDAGSEETLFRIAQEALANVARHSQAQTLRVQLLCSPQQVTLIIHDDGCGFDPTMHHAGVGQQTMRERAATLPGGRLKIESTPGLGTTITVYAAPSAGVWGKQASQA